MRIKLLMDNCDNSQDCVNVLNREIRQSKWKRKTKFTLPGTYDEKAEVRVFTDGTDTVTIKVDDGDVSLLFIDLTLYRDVISKIQSIAKNYHSVDYSDVYLNPWDMKVWVVCGDSGVCYSTDSIKKVVQDLNNGVLDMGEEDVPDFNKFIPEIISTEFEAECFPEEDDPWIKVASINDLIDDLY